MKKVLIAVILLAVLATVGCKNKTSADSIEIESHLSEQTSIDIDNSLLEKISSFNVESDYSEMYKEYKIIVEHYKEHNCDILNEYKFKNLLKYMLYGTWQDKNDNKISYTYVYENYNDTYGSSWFNTTLPTSMKSDNDYYYYMDYKNEKVVIGYQDQITEDKTDNYLISFKESNIHLEILINSKSYDLFLDSATEKVVKGNAKLAYIYIAKNIYNFKNPESVKVIQCYVDHKAKTVYAIIQASNSFGGTIKTKYMLWKNDATDSYYISEIQYSYNDSNVDLDELNKRLKNFVNNK